MDNRHKINNISRRRLTVDILYMQTLSRVHLQGVNWNMKDYKWTLTSIYICLFASHAEKELDWTVKL